MPTAKAGYYVDETRVPSVTTIIGRFKEAGGLIHWAWKLGMEGKDYREIRDQAANAGTIAHEAVEKWIHGGPETDISFNLENEIERKAAGSFKAFLEWSKQTNLRVEQTELPLISKKHMFGGTFDAILVQGKRSVGDWKSSNAIYPEYLVQIAAYGKLWEENYPDLPIDGGFHLLRFDKEYGDFHHHYWAELDAAWIAFLHLRELYELDKELKARVK